MKRLTPQSIWSVCRIVVLALLALTPLFAIVPVHAVQVLNRSVQISSSTVSASNIDYRVSVDVVIASTIGSMVVEFCSNDPFVGTACVAPSGFSASSTTISAQSGIVNFSVNPLSTANAIILSRPVAANFNPATISFTLSHITNPDSVTPFYARISTHTSLDGTGAYNNFGGIALMTNKDINLSAEVPPYLLFCSATSFSGYDCDSATNYFADFGELSTSTTKGATSQLIVGTNADFGLNVTVIGNTLTSGNNTILAMASLAGPSIGTPQFGINLRANSNPIVGADVVGPGSSATVMAAYDNPNQYKFASGDTIITASGVVDFRKFTASYVVNINTAQAPGMYSTTITYICLANF